MSVKVAINGFGRIGRLAFRQMFGAEGFPPHVPHGIFCCTQLFGIPPGYGISAKYAILRKIALLANFVLHLKIISEDY